MKYLSSLMSSSFSLALDLPLRALLTMTAGTATPAAHQACTMEPADARMRLQVGETEVQPELVWSPTLVFNCDTCQEAATNGVLTCAIQRV